MKRIFTICLMSLVLLSGVCFNSYAANKAPVNKVPTKPVQAEVVESAEEVKTVVNEVKVDDETEFDFKQIAARFTEIEENIKNDNFTRQSLEDASAFLTETDLALENGVRKLERNLAYAQDALAAFGDGTEADGEPDPDMAEIREKYAAHVAMFKNKLIEGNLLRAEVARLSAAISDARGRILIGNLVAEKNALVVPKTFWRAVGDSMLFFWNITASPVEWYQGLDEDGKNELHHRGWYVLLILALALSFGYLVRNYIIRHWGYRRTEETPGYGQKVVVAIMTALAYGVIPSLFLGGCLLWCITNHELMATKFGISVASALYFALFIILVRALARVILAPWNGRWRLFNISDARAERVFASIALCIFLYGIGAYFYHLCVRFDGSVELKLLIDVAMDFIKAFAIIFITVAVFGDIKTKAEDKADEAADSANTDNDVDDNDNMNSNVRVILFATVFSLATFSISLFGYPDLASFIFNRFFASVILFGIFVVVRTMIFDILKRSIIFWIRTYKMRKRLLSKVDFLMSLLITPTLLLVLIYFMLRLWGMPGSVLLYGVKKLVFGFKVGGINISLLAILTGLLVFIVALTIVKMFRRKLSHSLLNRINMDEGIKHTLLSVVSFIGVLIAIILAMIAMGIDLSNLAVIAGALSVGIGFGLQDVIKNFVSGIILLFERPFKVGDWVILGGEEGIIKQINIRSTELETWTKRSVIIPNATLLSSSLVNLTHGDKWQRQSVVVGVSYDSDVEKVSALLLECAKENKKVARVPAPAVLFKDFGASSLDFELRFHVSNVWTDWSVGSEIRYAILRRFREEGIEIAYPQLDIHQR